MSILVLDLARILTESRFAQDAQASLEARYQDARSRFEGMRAQGKGSTGPAAKALADDLATFEQKAVSEIEEERARLQRECLERAQAIAHEIASARGAAFVLDKRAAPVAPDDADITAEVLAKLDAG